MPVDPDSVECFPLLQPHTTKNAAAAIATRNAVLRPVELFGSLLRFVECM